MKSKNLVLVGLYFSVGLIQQLIGRHKRELPRPQEVTLSTTDGLELTTWVY